MSQSGAAGPERNGLWSDLTTMFPPDTGRPRSLSPAEKRAVLVGMVGGVAVAVAASLPGAWQALSALGENVASLVR